MDCYLSDLIDNPNKLISVIKSVTWRKIYLDSYWPRSWGHDREQQLWSKLFKIGMKTQFKLLNTLCASQHLSDLPEATVTTGKIWTMVGK